jgi:hypothetical protein
MSGIRKANLMLALLAGAAPIAHVLELPNKLALDGPLWLAVQQHLYRGWGPWLGAPVEIGALATALVLAFERRNRRRTLRLTLLAVGAYAGMLAAFLLFNAPVNAAVNGWTAATLPANWADYRLKWEAGHAIAALLSLIGLYATLRCLWLEAEEEQPRGMS